MFLHPNDPSISWVWVDTCCSRHEVIAAMAILFCKPTRGRGEISVRTM